MNSYQILTDTPSQNDFPIPSSNKNFTQEAHSKYPQLPPINSNQPPSTQYYSPQYVAVGIPVRFYPRSCEYAAFEEDPRFPLHNKILDIENQLNKGWFLVYRIWLYLIVGACCLVCGEELINFVILLIYYEKDLLPAIILVMVTIGLCIWGIQQALVVKNAMNSKNLEAARRALRSMIWFAFYYFFSMMMFFVILELIRKEIVKESWILAYVLAFVGVYVIPVSINVFGAGRVINLLEKRKALVFVFEEKYGSYEWSVGDKNSVQKKSSMNDIN